MTSPAWLTRLEQFHPFTEQEAWNLFRFIAIAEAVGWTVLILGIGIQDYLLPGSNFAIPIAGQIHGMIFIAYFGVLLATFTSLSWSRPKTLLAVVAGIPPYGTLAFEQWAARTRRKELIRRTYRRIVVAGLIVQDDAILAIQPSDRPSWLVPSGVIEAGEDPPEALVRVIHDLTGITPMVGNLRVIRRLEQARTETIEMYFVITNPDEFVGAKPKTSFVDDIRFVTPRTTDLMPDFLHRLTPAHLSDATAPVEFL